MKRRQDETAFEAWERIGRICAELRELAARQRVTLFVTPREGGGLRAYVYPAGSENFVIVDSISEVKP